MPLLLAQSSPERFGQGYALAAYLLIFATYFGYVGFLHLSHRRLRQRLDELDRRLEEQPRRTAPTGD